MWPLLLLSGSLLCLSAIANPGNSTNVQGACKRGIASASQNPQDVARVQTSASICWQYGWNVYPPSGLPAGITHVPMLWGREGMADFTQHVRSQSAQTILAFNEPDISQQSNMTPREAAGFWLAHIQPLKSSGVRLGSPAVSSSPSGIQWMREFLNECHGCTIDFLAFHWYGEGVQNFRNYVQSFHTAFPGYPLWITEFASTSGDTSVVLDFLTQNTRWLDSIDWIEKYSWFIFGRDSTGLNSHLLDSGGNLNSLGRQYAA